MNNQEITAIATTMIAFSTFIGVGSALLYYLFLTQKLNTPKTILYATIYILINITFLYALLRTRKNAEKKE